MVNDVFEEPLRHERGVQARMDADDAVVFLDGAENKIFLGSEPPAASPGDRVTAQGGLAEIPLVDLGEDGFEIEVLPLVVERQLALQKRLGMRDFTLCFGHGRGSVRGVR